MSVIQGSCLCGQIGYEVSSSKGIFQYCHCSRCRKFTGSAFASNLLLRPEQFRWLEGEELLGRYEPPQAKYFATSFCTNCGSSMPWRNKTGSIIVVPAGTLAEAPQVRVQHCIYTNNRAPWFIDPAELPQYAELPPR